MVCSKYLSKKLNEIDTLLNAGDFNEALLCSEEVIKSGCLNYSLFRKLAISAFYMKKQRVLLRRLIEFDLNDCKVNNIIAGLAGNLKDEEINRKYALKVAAEKPILTSRKSSPSLSILVLQTIASGAYKFKAKTGGFHISEGHNNIMTVLDRTISKTILRVDSLEAAKKAILNLKDIDIIYNNITDAERCFQALKNADEICKILSHIPVINHPQHTLNSSRENNFERFSNNSSLIFPKVIKLDQVGSHCQDKVLTAIYEHSLSFPLIVRLAGFQAGKNMLKIEGEEDNDFSSFEEIIKTQPTDIYIIEFKDCSFNDERLPNVKLYPKFRAMLVADKLFPIHLFVAGNEYNVHRNNSKKIMHENQWLVELERKYCQDPTSLINSEIWNSLQTTLMNTQLDYVGVDFSLDEMNNKKEQKCIRLPS